MIIMKIINDLLQSVLSVEMTISLKNLRKMMNMYSKLDLFGKYFPIGAAVNWK